MSWPYDGLPRYKLVVNRGFLTHFHRSTQTPEHIQVLILDRAANHRIVASWSSEVVSHSWKLRGGTPAREYVLAQGKARLAELNG